ncbi:chymotrypsinogen A-like [Haemaphysalis longicornis]
MKLYVVLFAFFAKNVVAYEVGTDDANCGQTPIPPKLDEEDRIFGGSVAVPGSWPWHAGIFTNELFPKHICSGALISDRHVITAAHCLLKKTSKMLRIHLGAHDRGSVEAEAVSVAVDEVCFHKEYKPPHTNDIAILTLKEAVNFTKTIGPVCLPKAMHELPENTDAYVTGWGRHKAGSDELAPQLKQLRTRTMWHKTCILDYAVNVPESVLCTGHDFGSSCKGDSGGPLVWNSGSAWTLEGVVSGGPVKCANPDDPLLFTKVSHQIDPFILPYLRAKDVAEKHQICKIL